MTVSRCAVRHRLSDFLARDRQLPAPQLLSIGTTDTVCQPRTPPLGQTCATWPLCHQWSIPSSRIRNTRPISEPFGRARQFVRNFWAASKTVVVQSSSGKKLRPVLRITAIYNLAPPANTSLSATRHPHFSFRVFSDLTSDLVSLLGQNLCISPPSDDLLDKWTALEFQNSPVDALNSRSSRVLSMQSSWLSQDGKCRPLTVFLPAACSAQTKQTWKSSQSDLSKNSLQPGTEKDRPLLKFKLSDRVNC